MWFSFRSCMQVQMHLIVRVAILKPYKCIHMIVKFATQEPYKCIYFIVRVATLKHHKYFEDGARISAGG